METIGEVCRSQGSRRKGSRGRVSHLGVEVKALELGQQVPLPVPLAGEQVVVHFHGTVGGRRERWSGEEAEGGGRRHDVGDDLEIKCKSKLLPTMQITE